MDQEKSASHTSAKYQSPSTDHSRPDRAIAVLIGACLGWTVQAGDFSVLTQSNPPSNVAGLTWAPTLDGSELASCKSVAAIECVGPDLGVSHTNALITAGAKREGSPSALTRLRISRHLSDQIKDKEYAISTSGQRDRMSG